MKKITFMLLAALIAVASWAGVPAKGLRTKAMPLTTMKAAPAKQFAPTKKAATVRLQAPVASKMAQKAKAGAKKAPKKVGLADLLTKQYMLCSQYYEYDSEAGGLVEALPAAGGSPVTFEQVDEQTVAINGFTSDATEKILATFATTTDEELLAEGVIAEVSIADGQTLFESSYGPVLLSNVTGEDGAPIMAYVFADGTVMFDDIWADVLGGDGQYAGYLWSGYYYYSMALPVNGTMTWAKGGTENEVPVVIDQDPEAPKYVTVYNFADEGTAVVVTMKEDNKFAIESQLVFDGGSTYGQFYTYATDGSTFSATITGTGTEDALTFDDTWTLYAPETGYWYNVLQPATIAYTDGTQFVYPVIPDVAATPANPEIVALGEYDSSKGYGYVIADVPVVDVDGNELKESLLSYAFYAEIAGEVVPVEFTTELYKNLDENITEIPYGLNDSYDFDTNEGYKIVFLNYDFSNYDKIGIKSIYRGGGETIATEIQWYDPVRAEALEALETEIENAQKLLAEEEKTFGRENLEAAILAAQTVLANEKATAEELNAAIEALQEAENAFIMANQAITVTFNFNAMDVAVSSGSGESYVADGDITETLELTAEEVTLAISPAAEGKTATRFWDANGNDDKVTPQLRCYGNTLTFSVPEGKAITTIVFNYGKYWGGSNGGKVTADTGVIKDDTSLKAATWTGEAETVVFTIEANTQINSIAVTYISNGEEPVDPTEAVDPDGLTFNFEDGTMQGWTTIDADGDGYDWAVNTSFGGHDGSTGVVFSQSYDNNAGALTPDNYFVSPKFKLGAPIKFYACAQDASYPAENFAVAVSTAGNTDAADFTNVEEWTLTAARANAPKKVQGNWYEYTVDLSAYKGQEGYVAIRHFDCTDKFYMLVDDISFGTPEFEIEPAEGVVESLKDFEITFNKYEVGLVMEPVATLKNETANKEWTTTTFMLADGKLSFSIAEEEITEPGDYTLTVTGVKNGEEDIELIFAYTIAEPLVLVELPEGVEAQEYTLEAAGSDSQSSYDITDTKLVAFDGNDVYLQGLAYYFPEAFVKGTLTEEGQVLVPSGQYVGTDSYGDEFLVALDTDADGYLIDSESGVIAFDYDAESGVLSLVEDTYYGESGSKDAEELYNYVYSAVYTPGAYVLPDVVELPEGAEVNNWYLAAYDSENLFVNREVGVAVVDNDIYVQGMCDYLPEAWVKGTIDGNKATFATGQFYGTYNDTYNLFFVGYGEDVEDVVFSYDAENGLLAAENLIELAGDQKGNKIYDYYYDVEISRDRPDSFPVEAPEGLETETYLFTANVVTAGEDDDEDISFARKAEANGVTFDFNAMDVATSDNNGGTAGDIIEALTLTEGDVTLTISPKEEGKTTENRFWGTASGPQLRVYSGTLTFSVPEGSSMTQIEFNAGKWNDGNSADSGEFDGATWTGDAQTVVVTIAANTQINSIAVTLKGEGGNNPDPEEPVVEKNYSYQVEVGFDGNNVYFSGINSDCSEYWMRGTLSEDGKTVTIPAGQYMGGFSFWGYVFDYYIAAMDEEGNMADVVLNYDAENASFTTAQSVVLNGSKFDWDPYQTFTDVEIVKMPDFAATPADPTLEACDLTKDVGYNKIYASIPAKDVDGNDLLTSKLYYIVWIEKDDNQVPYTFTADLYSYDFEEDVTEVPYNHDGYDIYAGGEIIYLEDDLDELATWKNVGIQSVYYGGGERNVSNIVWCAEENLTTGIANVNVENGKNVVIFDLQGRRVAAPAKGLYIMNGKKVVVK